MCRLEVDGEKHMDAMVPFWYTVKFGGEPMVINCIVNSTAYLIDDKWWKNVDIDTMAKKLLNRCK